MRASINNTNLLRAAGLCVGLSALTASSALAGDTASGGLSVQDLYEGVQTYTGSRGVEMFYGAPMTVGATAEQAAAAFIAQHADEFGKGDITLTLTDTTTVRDGRFTVFMYDQEIDGLPVHLGMARILVLDRGFDHAVVYAAGNLAQDLPGDLRDDVFVSGANAQALAMSDLSFADFVDWTEPELVAFDNRVQDAEVAETRAAWRTMARHAAYPLVDEAYEVFIDAKTGEQIFVGSIVHNVDVDGTARGFATPGTAPDITSNPETEQALPLTRVRISGGATAVSEVDGTFTIAHGGTTAVTVNAELNGPFVNVTNESGSDLTASTIVTPPGPANLLFNASPTEFGTAQVNALIGTNLSYDLIKSRAPGFIRLDRVTPANVNLNDSCNAFFSGFDLSINFFRALGGCVNTSYSTVIAHEYGHFVVNRLGLAQQAFGEGYADTIAMLLYDTGLVGEQFFGAGSGPVRNPEAARRQFPCTSSSIHTCGQILGGTWRWTRLNLGDTHGSAEGLEMARDMFVGWSLITLGGESTLTPASSRTAIEFLTIDDDDGILANGTPNYAGIRAAFDRHGISWPELDISVIEAPSTLAAGESGQVRVTIDDSTAAFVTGSQMLGLVIDGATQMVPMVADGDGFVADIPGQPGLTDVSFFVTADADTGETTRMPSEGGFPVLVGEAIVSLDFESAPGWTVQNEALEAGAWERGVPQGAGDDRSEDPPTDFDGSGAGFFTDPDAGNTDVDGGPTRLLSPVYDLSTYDDALISYARWFRNDDVDADRLRIEFSDDGGSTWSLAENVADTPEGWVTAALRVSDVVDITDQFRVRFSATDNPNDSVTEAGLDAFRVIVAGDPVCRADLDGNGELNIFDFLEFQNLFGAGDLAADFDGNGVLNIFDFLAFQNEFDAGC